MDSIKMRSRISHIVYFLTLIFAVHCFAEAEQISEEATSITKAKRLIEQNQISGAIRILETYQTEHPLSIEIPAVEKMLIYCYFHNNDYPMLQAASDRFLFEHVDDKHADYIAYLRFIGAMHLANGYPYEWLPIERASRDVSAVKDVFLMGKNFLITYPASQYASDVAHHLPTLKDTIARSYYLRGEMLMSRGETIGGIRAFQMVTSQLGDTQYAPQAQAYCDKFQKKLTLVKEYRFNESEKSK
ncbi:MAG: outer membrane protein assembly factor BamD [Gammaproteobacteria bacterium]|nr:outer membrane protein assembly factor BamD [Gammaproteobacteria bacterium]